MARHSDPPLLTKEQHELYKKYPYVRFIWRTQPGACERCEALEGKDFSYEDIQARGRIHPNCLCRVEVDPDSIREDGWSIPVTDFFPDPLGVPLSFYRFKYRFLPRRNMDRWHDCVLLWEGRKSEKKERKFALTN